MLPELRERLTDYYDRYYRVELGLRNAAEHIESRLDEDRIYGELAERVFRSLAVELSGRKVLVVGCGTGAEVLCLLRKGAEVYALEPSVDALDISRLKVRESGLNGAHFIQSTIEGLDLASLPRFDFIYCHTVLEHTQNPWLALDQMTALLSEGGKLYLGLPDYRVPFEPHYKMLAPTFLSKPLLKAYFKIMGRPTEFVDTLQLLNARMLRRYLARKPGICARFLEHPVPVIEGGGLQLRNRVFRLFHQLGVEKNQQWLIFKSSSDEGA